MTTPEQQQAWQDAIGDVVTPGQVLGDKYRLDGLLGAGGMGAVLEAWHLHFEERVAVKLMLSQIGASATARARFEREARSAFKIKSEHAARALDIGFLESGQPFIVMEYLEGQDLQQLLDARGPLPVQEAVDYVLQACEAVAEAHVRKIVHRDLKPDNLFLTQGIDGGPCIKVVDFGISKEGADASDPEAKDPSLLTAAGTTLGTPAYMSPEQWGSAQSVGPQADIWALGVILHQLVSGLIPFPAETLRELFTAVMAEQPVPLRTVHPDFPEQLESAVLRCLAKEPEDRFASVAELAVAIGPLGSQSAQESVARIARVQRIEGIASSYADGGVGVSVGASYGVQTGPGVTPAPGVQTGAGVTPAPGVQTGAGVTPAPGVQTGAGVTPAPVVQTGAGVTPATGGHAPVDPTVVGQPVVGTASGASPGATPQAWQGASAEQAPSSAGKLIAVAAVVVVVLVLGAGAMVAMHFSQSDDPALAASGETSDGEPSTADTSTDTDTIASSSEPTSSASEEPAPSSSPEAVARPESTGGQPAGPSGPSPHPRPTAQPQPTAPPATTPAATPSKDKPDPFRSM